MKYNGLIFIIQFSVSCEPMIELRLNQETVDFTSFFKAHVPAFSHPVNFNGLCSEMQGGEVAAFPQQLRTDATLSFLIARRSSFAKPAIQIDALPPVVSMRAVTMRKVRQCRCT